MTPVKNRNNKCQKLHRQTVAKNNGRRASKPPTLQKMKSITFI